jgi:hypothetical protein
MSFYDIILSKGEMIMKKSMYLLLAALVGATSASYAETNIGPRAASSADLTSGPATRPAGTVNYQKYETRTTTRTYDVKDGNQMYYSQPARRSDMYKQYDATRDSVSSVRSEVVRREAKRKYYLAHPFFQPLKGKFGSITDFSYAENSYDFSFVELTSGIYDKTGGELMLFTTDGDFKTSQFAIKEDFSYGITDRIAIMGMLRYDSSDYKFNWADGSPSDETDDSGLNMFGLGAQWRFVDTTEWIGAVSAYYQHQKDAADYYVLDLKAGYKVSASTIYGMLRGWYLDLDGNSYGAGVSSKDTEGYNGTFYLGYQVGDDTAMYIEGGLGVFSVLNEDWTLNVEGVFGDYDWHNQFSIKGAIGWQPGDMLALNLYAKASLYDSADDKKVKAYYWRENTVDSMGNDWVGLSPVGTVKLENYSEFSVGLQAIFQF